ncbi:MAG: hypothetical protein ACXU8O_00110 [Asticcacaulis sp.]
MSTPPADNSPGAVMADYAGQALELIEQGLGHVPDFTPGSVILAEALAGCIHADLPQDFLDHERKLDPWTGEGDPELDAVCKMLGGYVGEVILRTSGGEWIMDEPRPAAPPVEMVQVFPGRVLDPVGWVRSRILLGPEHNVFAQFEAATGDEALGG